MDKDKIFRVVMSPDISSEFSPDSILELNFDDLVSFVSNPVCDSETYDKLDLPLIYPFDMDIIDFSKKSKTLSKALSVLVIDSDNGNKSFDETCEILKKWDYSFVAHTTYNSRPLCEKYRIFFPLRKSLPMKYFNHDAVKQALISVFDAVVDPSSFDWRGFLFPCKTPYYKSCVHIGEDYMDLYSESWKKRFTRYFSRFKMNQEKMKCRNKTGLNIDVSKCKSVTYYLSQRYNKKEGNVDSNISLYRAIVACVRNNDNKTLNTVLNKAKSEGWTDKYLEQKITSAKRSK
jgi:hypothetical protein